MIYSSGTSPGGGSGNGSSSGCVMTSTGSDVTVSSPPIPGTSPRNSSPVRDDGNLSNNLTKIELNQSGDKKGRQVGC